MNQKDLIKYGLLALGAYLIWKYIQDHGGLEGIMGTTAIASTTTPSVNTGTSPTPPLTNVLPNAPATPTPPAPHPPAPPVLDMTGLVVVPDINDSLTGTVKLNGVPTRLSIITASGQIYDSTGQEVTAALQSQGVDIVGLRTAFANAGAGVSGLGAVRFIPAWLM